MKRIFTKTCAILISVLSFSSVNAQTNGTLTFSFDTPSRSGYSGTKHVMAIWIQDSNGNFIKTKMRNAGPSTADHLPTWSVNAGGSSWNCLSNSANVVDATTGATLPSYTTRTISWDGKDVNGNANGVTVADGTYKVSVEMTWNHGNSNTVMKSFTFTKGTTADNQTPVDDANFTNVNLSWTPSTTTSINEIKETNVKLYPNPNNGTFYVEYDNATVINVENIIGEIIKSETLNNKQGVKAFNLSSFPNGTYFVVVINGTNVKKHKVIVSK